MAVRLTWTNNSSAHDGTYVYRSTATMDPQALPAPIADLPAGSEEYIDGVAAQQAVYYYRVQDHEGGQVSTVSDELIADFVPDYGSAQVGDYIGGGVYAGTITYADARQFHIIFAIQAGEIGAGTGVGLAWGYQGTTTGATDLDDGKSNSDIIAGLGGSPAFDHCLQYVSDGFEDWYLPARHEAELEVNLRGHPEISSPDDGRWTSTETSATKARFERFSDNFSSGEIGKDVSSVRTRPIRRVPV